MVKAQEVEFGSWGGIEDVGKSHWSRSGEGRHARGLNRDIEGVLKGSRRQHIAHDLRRHGADSDLSRGHRLAVGSDKAARRNIESELAALKGTKIGRAVSRRLNLAAAAVTDALQDTGGQTGQ